MKVAKVFACLIIWLLMSNRRYGHNYKNCCVTTQIFLFAWFGVEQFPFFCVRVWMLLGLLFFLSFFFFFFVGDTTREELMSVRSAREWRSGEGQSLREVNQSFFALLFASLLPQPTSLSLSLSPTPSLRRVFSLPDTHTHAHTQRNDEKSVELLSCSTCVGCVRSN